MYPAAAVAAALAGSCGASLPTPGLWNPVAAVLAALPTKAAAAAAATTAPAPPLGLRTEALLALLAALQSPQHPQHPQHLPLPGELGWGTPTLVPHQVAPHTAAHHTSTLPAASVSGTPAQNPS